VEAVRPIDFYNSSHQEDVKLMFWLPSTAALSKFCPSIDTKLVDLLSSLDEDASKYRSFWCSVPSIMDLVPVLRSVQCMYKLLEQRAIVCGSNTTLDLTLAGP